MLSHTTRWMALVVLSLVLGALPAIAQDSNILLQCPDSTVLHPTPGDPAIKCLHLMAGDGMVTMADDYEGSGAGKPLYVFSFALLPDGGPAPNTPEYPGYVMDEGVLAANAPAPTLAVDEDDEFFLTLTNVGMAVRPDLFDPHTVHWHGFPQASSVFDGVPDASISINMGASLTYYYNAKDAGTYMYHCHVEAAEHMQMGMLGNLYVRPRQNRCDTIADDPAVPGSICPAGHVNGVTQYAYDDGDGSTSYAVEAVIQVGSFDPDFHDASFNVQPLPFAGMRDRYFLMNGRGYPDTVNPNVLFTEDPLGKLQPSQPVTSLIEATPGQRILLRLSNLSVTQFYTVGWTGAAGQVVGLDARLLRDGAGNNLYEDTNSVTLGGGQSADVIITAPSAPGTLFVHVMNLDQLANDAENFGGMMTEIRVN